MGNTSRKKATDINNEKKAQEYEEARELLRKQLGANKPRYNSGELLAYRFADYIVGARRSERPLTETGLAVGAGAETATLERYESGKMDYLSGGDIPASEDQIDINLAIERYRARAEEDEEFRSVYDFLSGERTEKGVLLLSTPCRKARQLVSLDREERLSTSGKVADIFTMKAREGWQDEREQRISVLKIGEGNAQSALALLGYEKKKR